jgi:hypothetical protein
MSFMANNNGAALIPNQSKKTTSRCSISTVEFWFTADKEKVVAAIKLCHLLTYW